MADQLDPQALWGAVPSAWAMTLNPVLAGPQGQRLALALQAAQADGDPIYPVPAQRLAALALPPDAVRVVILGQDPYHQPGQAQGLAFSVPAGVSWPPSLRNVLKEWQQDLHQPPPQSGDLSPWVQQGVLLLNTALTVPQGRAGGHARLGWTPVIDAILSGLMARDRPLAFCLWGQAAQARVLPMLRPPHRAWCAAHPSPLSAHRGGWFGSRPFSQTRDWLLSQGLEAPSWHLPTQGELFS